MISVDFDGSRLLLQVPYAMNHAVRSLPSRKWDPRRKCWIVPAIEANLKQLRLQEQMGTKIEYTDAARNAINTNAADNIKRQAGFGEFPRGYPFADPQPYDHQRGTAVDFYSVPSFMLNAGMGTGKTRMAIDIHCARFIAGHVQAVVVVCPVTILRNWRNEILKFSPAEARCAAVVLDPDKPKQLEELSKHDGLRWLIVGVESLSSGRAFGMAMQWLRNQNPAALIVDESSKVKNSKATRTQRVHSLADEVEQHSTLTGTPISKGIEDLYAQYRVLGPNILGYDSFWSFRNRYCIMGGYKQKQIVGYQNVDELMTTIGPFTKLIKKEDCLDLPPKVYERRTIKMSSEQAQMYTDLDLTLTMMTQKGESLTAQNVLEQMLRMSEITGGFYSTRDEDTNKVSKHAFTKNPKLDELEELLSEHDGQSIIWCNFHTEAQAIIERLGAENCGVLLGYVAPADRQRYVEEFQAGRLRYMVGTAATGGMGITLTAASLVVYYGNTYNYIDRVQSEDRAHRIGQTKSVTYVDLVCEGTIDEDVLKSLEAKQSMSDFVQNTIKARGLAA